MKRLLASGWQSLSRLRGVGRLPKTVNHNLSMNEYFATTQEVLSNLKTVNFNHIWNAHKNDLFSYRGWVVRTTANMR